MEFLDMPKRLNCFISIYFFPLLTWTSTMNTFPLVEKKKHITDICIWGAYIKRANAFFKCFFCAFCNTVVEAPAYLLHTRVCLNTPTGKRNFVNNAGFSNACCRLAFFYAIIEVDTNLTTTRLSHALFVGAALLSSNRLVITPTRELIQAAPALMHAITLRTLLVTWWKMP